MTDLRVRRLVYVVLVGIPLAGTAVVLRAGAVMHPVATASAPSGTTSLTVLPGDVTLRLGTFLAQLIVILALCRALGRALEKIGQPFVVGEMLSGILLGPSVLGAFWPEAYARLFPPGSVRFLGAVSQLGLVLFMFLVGLRLHPRELRGRGHAAVLTSHTSIVFPLFLGSSLALVLYPALAMPGVGFVPFALFVGAAMSVTAFPVLARMLAERNLTNTSLGSLALACAAVDDVSAWCILAFVAVVAREGTTSMLPLLALGGTVAWTAMMLAIGRPWLARWAEENRLESGIGRGHLALVLLVALGSAFVTQTLGTHALFGAFLAGVAMPKSDGFVRELARPLEDVLLVLLLPLFFASTGIRLNLGFIGSAGLWPAFVMILGVAILGKIGGSAVAARSAGLSWRPALTLGALMNTRGLMGLVILNAGIEIGVLSQPLYVMMVLMSILTTLMAAPLLHVFSSAANRAEDVPVAA